MSPSSVPALDALLATKLYIPALRPNRVPRPRLTERLDEGTAGPLTLISAPAGFGKSTLLSEWVHESGRPVAWVSLDEGDDEVSRFLLYVLSALQRVRPGLGEAALATLRHAQAPSAEILEPLLTGLLNEVHGLDEEVVLVLDDYHALEDATVHRAVQFLLDRLPPCLHLVIATRVDPPLALSRLRARGQLTELRGGDLRFTSEEAAGFLNQAMGLALSPADVEALEERTEGWAVGLQMAALSLQGRQDAGRFIEQFTGSHRFVLDYLTDEVLSRLPEDLRDFLLRTSILERLSGPLAGAVTELGEGEGQAVLERLEAANLFLIPLDDTRTWYRYHHLFATLLRHQLERARGSGEVTALHERASDWYAAHGHPEDALEHALAAGAHDRAAELMSQHALPRLMRGDAVTVVRWAQALPFEWVRRLPWLRLVYTWALMATFRLPEAEEQVREMEGELAREPNPELEAQVETLRALFIRVEGRTEEAIALYRRALERLPEEDIISRTIVLLELGMTALLVSDFAAAEEAFHKAEAASRASGTTMGVLLAQCHLAQIRIAQGRLHEAADLARRSVKVASEGMPPGEAVSPGASLAFAILADVEREWNHLDTAWEHASQADELGRRGGIADGMLGSAFVRMRILSARGDFPRAFAALDQAEEVIRRTGQPRWLEIVGAFCARLNIRRFRVEGTPEPLAAAARWARESGLLENWTRRREIPFLQDHQIDVAALTLGRILLAQGETDRALELLAELRREAEAQGWGRTVIEASCLEALGREARGDRAGAVAATAKALALAEPEGFVRIFVSEGPVMAELVEQAAPGVISADYAQRLRAAFGLAGAAPAPRLAPAAAPPAVEALSERETEVLRLVASGLSNAEAGRKLFIAPSTVKKHLENIYDKLGTRSRTQAIARAREIGLL
jgi:LuxR family maltose regulon positive regulatory protein